MKKFFTALSLITFFMFFAFLGFFVNASECNICAYDQGGCIVDRTPDNPSNYGTSCECSSGLICSRDGSTQNCKCQKAFGSGLLNVTETSGLNTTNSVPQIVGNVIKVILGISGTVALIFIVWGGIQWMISKGEESKIASARKLMVSGMVGIAIIAAAYAITDFVIKQITVVAGA